MTCFYKWPLMAALTMVMLIMTDVPSQAEPNEFGPRFTNTTPAALSDTVTPVYMAQEPSADGLNEIVPAAGADNSDAATLDAERTDAIIVPQPQDQTESE